VKQSVQQAHQSCGLTFPMATAMETIACHKRWQESFICLCYLCVHVLHSTRCARSSDPTALQHPLQTVHVYFHWEVATQIMASADGTFCPWGSPYYSSHWIGRSVNGLPPCCHHRGGRPLLVHAFNSSCSLLWIVFELTKWQLHSW